jgi:hypothetical protein
MRTCERECWRRTAFRGFDASDRFLTSPEVPFGNPFTGETPVPPLRFELSPAARYPA